MKRSTGRILTTHVGSLPRPPDLLDMIQAKERGGSFDAAAFAARVKSAVAEVVRRQAEAGIDIIADGEMGRFGFIPMSMSASPASKRARTRAAKALGRGRASISRSPNITLGRRRCRARLAARSVPNGCAPARSSTRDTRRWRATSTI